MPILVAVRRSCRKGGGSDRQRDTVALDLTSSTANVYGKATRSRTHNRRRVLVKIVRATCSGFFFLINKICIKS